MIKMIRSLFARWAAVLLCAVVLAGAANAKGGRPSDKAKKKPNILLILVDDLKPALGTYGDRTAISPNLDRLAKRGMRFDLAYANQAVCAPSRINLMTGTRSTTSGVYRFDMDFRKYLPGAMTMPQYFQSAGYHTESMGKVYHIGHGTLDDKAGWSVPHHKEKVVEYLVPASTKGLPTREEALFNEVPVKGNVFEYARTLARGAAWERPDVADDAYADGRIANRAVARLSALSKEQKPFFLAVGFARPHLPFSVPDRYWRMYDPAKLPMPEFEKFPQGMPAFAGKVAGEIAAYEPVPDGVNGDKYPEELTRTLLHGYYAGVTYVDAQIGKVMAHLDRLGLSENTIVVLWGDHGYHLGDHGLWTKHTNLEQAVRIPLIFAGPGVVRGHTRQPSETVDIYPTLAKLAGLARPQGPQPVEGVDLSPVLKRPSKRVRDHAYHAFNRPDRIGQAIRTERYRLVRWTQEKTGERAYELYDLQKDPLETRNVANEKTAEVRKIERILDRHPKPASVNLK